MVKGRVIEERSYRTPTGLVGPATDCPAGTVPCGPDCITPGLPCGWDGATWYDESCSYLSPVFDSLSTKTVWDTVWWRIRQNYSGMDADKQAAYATLWHCLGTTAKLIAPFTPFLAETMWRNLAGAFGGRVLESVHLCDYPACGAAAVDDVLSERMTLLRDIASLGRKARMDAKLKVRQPLAKVEVILAKDTHQAWLQTHDDLLRDELNVKQVEYAQQAADYITYEVLPNFKRLGPRIGKLLPKVKQLLTRADGGRLLAELEATGKVTLDADGQRVELDSEDLQVRLQAKPGWAAAHLPSCVVVLSTDLTPQLVREGLARDLVRLIQERRKELDCQYTDRIQVGLVTESDELRQAIEENAEYIRGETLAVELSREPLAGATPVEHDLAGSPIEVHVVTVPAASVV